MNEPQQTLDRQWKATCRAIFGREVGGMEKYGAWLSEGLEPVERVKSAVSGKETLFYYFPNNKWSRK